MSAMKPGYLGTIIGLTICLSLLGCEVLKDPTDDESQVSDGTASQEAVAQLADATDGEVLPAGVGYALYAPEKNSRGHTVSRWLAEWIGGRTAMAAGISACATPAAFTIPGSAGVLSQNYTPPTGCDMSFSSGAVGEVTWAGFWTQTFSGNDSNCSPNSASPHGLLVGSGNPQGCSLSRESSGITRTLSIAGGNTVVVERSTRAASGYETPVAGPIVATCQPGMCPDSNVTGSGTRAITIKGTHVRTFKNGKLIGDETISTPVAIWVTGWGTSRQIVAGSVVTQHNLAHYTSTTTVEPGSPLIFSIEDCPYPLSGALSTTFSGTKYDTKKETVTFGPQCGSATVMRTNDTPMPTSLTE
jgi:hypothetical protein